ncbi:Xaa-Pro dipeptidase [Patescibacteria group bacterium]|nr:MAG: Xaa-Pro dipeptidase [Patescibacteria group bacterium]
MKDEILSLYSAHITEQKQKVLDIISISGFDALIIYSGTPLRYYTDDQDAPFRAYAHFAHWTPLNEPGNFLLIHPNIKPLLIRVKPDDFWHEQTSLKNNFWLSEFDFREVSNADSAWQELLNMEPMRSNIQRIAYIGDNPEWTKKRGIVEDCINPSELIASLDKNRSFKTEYEIACISKANEIAAKGHAVAKQMFLTGASELAIHQVYMYGVGCTEKELPYETIVALNEKGSTLHYQGKRTEIRGGKSLLLDAGANYLGYASDVTRTFVAPDADPLFAKLLAGVETLQRELCVLAKPGLSFVDLQKEAHKKIGDLLSSLRILNVSGEEAVSLGLTKAFFPHGVGHMLGLQVHDVGGVKKYSQQTVETENLRTNTMMEVGHVFTIEPGVYFIEMLLRSHRDGDTAKHFNWELIDRLAPYGGVRIEDDVLVIETGIRNLTREYLD